MPPVKGDIRKTSAIEKEVNTSIKIKHEFNIFLKFSLFFFQFFKSGTVYIFSRIDISIATLREMLF